MAETKDNPRLAETERVVIPQAKPAPAAPAPAPPASPPERDPKSPYTGPSEIVQGGRYVDGAKLVGGKLMGGRIVDANGKVLATFKDDQENTGHVEDGTPPEKE